MVDYRRNYLPGGSFFFTVNLQDRQSTFLTDHIDLLREAFRTVRSQQPFSITAIVILPEHLHTIWELPPEDDNFSSRWRVIKSLFTRSLVKRGVEISKNKKGEYSLWQRRFWEHTIRDENDLQRHVDYIHYNPVKHGWAARVKEWEYSSFHRYVKLGWINEDWGSDLPDESDLSFGE